MSPEIRQEELFPSGPPRPPAPAAKRAAVPPAPEAQIPEHPAPEQAEDEVLHPEHTGADPSNADPETDDPGSGLPPHRPLHGPIYEQDYPLNRLYSFNFLNYASYVICDRAIPHIVDGLKPVQRRILHSLHDRDDGRFMKVANIVGHTMQYHPHGDASIGDALVNLASKRYLIEGQGNFGNIYTGDRAAAARYIECRLTELARKELFNPALTAYVPSYDGRNKEPVTLPSKLPLLLMLGAEGIAVGLSTRILPHNFIELLQAQIAIIEERPYDPVYPDFIQGGLVDVSEYADGNGRVRVRAVIEARGHNRLVIKEVPFGTTTESLLASVEDAVRKKKVPVRSIKDYTAEEVEVELVLTPGADLDKAMASLYAFTQCENPISSRLIVISKENRPAEMTVDEVLRENVRQVLEILRLELELKRHNLLEELQSKTLVEIFIENRIYKRIEECKTYPAVQQAVFDGLEPFKDRLRRAVTPEDVEMLLGIRIRRISRFDMEKNRRDIEQILLDLKQTEKHLKALRKYAVAYLQHLVDTYAGEYGRRTRITSFDTIEVRELTSKELTIHHDRENGYIGTGITGEELFHCSSLDKLMLVWNDGRYQTIQPPEKLFVDQNMIYCGIFDRDRVFTCFYTDPDGKSYIKRFTFGGTILARDYELIPPGGEIHHLQEGTPEAYYVRYKPAKKQRVNRQVFNPAEVAVKGVKARGNRASTKAVARVTTELPRSWDASDLRNGG